MDSSELALTMLRWEEAKKQLDELTAIIQAAVLAIGKTQVVGNVRATYSEGRKTYDYVKAGSSAPIDIINKHTVPSVDWRSVCQEAGIEAPFTQSPSSVTLKLQE